MTIVVGADGSVASRAALTWAIDRARSTGDDLVLATVVDDGWGSVGGSALAGPEPGPDAAGACGTSPQQNTCRDGSDCCTGICRPTKNGKGRCRCVKVGKPCTSSKNCCSEGGDPMTCKGNRCLLV